MMLKQSNLDDVNMFHFKIIMIIDEKCVKEQLHLRY
jgi:hypothetical protein